MKNGAAFACVTESLDEKMTWLQQAIPSDRQATREQNPRKQTGF